MKLLAGLIMIVSGIHCVHAQMALSFSEAREMMMNKNIQVKINNKKIETANNKIKTSQSLMFPHFKAFGTASYVDRVSEIDLNDKRDGLATLLNLSSPAVLGNWDFTFQKKDMAFGGISMNWPIYAGGKIRSAVKISKISAEVTKIEKNDSEQSLVSELAGSYFKTKLAEEAVMVKENVVEVMNVHLSNSLKLERNGLIAGVEVLQAKVAVAEAERQLLSSKKDLSLARTALSATLEQEEMFILTSPFFLEENMSTLEEYKEKAAANYPQIQKLKLLEEIAQQGINAEKANYLPTVLLTGQKIIASHNYPLVKNPLTVGVTVTYDIFDGFGRKNKILTAKNEKEMIEMSREKLQLDIKTYVEKLYNELKKSNEQIVSLNQSIQLAEELVRIRKASFSEGMSTSTDVIDAELELSGKKIEQLKAYADYDINLAKLFEMCGIGNDYIRTAQ
ncbi:TolC family protein [Chryseobacterium phosphatilyticum]|uniref:TolC family protein n=1 Tax=Chryseobacterium phosphatilyticum TaxID=475075 RepID=A0A316XI90_9FLAO|nr:TolC family protein [Chryseobacterium phosphatilyticum]PWN71883.1 TolC family protein [Chryseobacterium phosphatilyticum]